MNTQRKPISYVRCVQCADVYANVGGDRGGDIRLAFPRPVPKAHGGEEQKGKCPKHPR